MRYYYGGTWSMRWKADADLYNGLRGKGMPAWRAALYWLFVRLFGGPKLHRFTTWAIGRPQAWAYGDGVFRYTSARI